MTRITTLAAIGAVGAAVLAGTAAGRDARPVTVQLRPVAGAQAAGTATLSAAGAGTRAVLRVRGLPAGAAARAVLNAGTDLAHRSASFAALPALRAGGNGVARAAGPVRFHGTEDVALAAIADGEHVVVVLAGGRAVAWGLVPRAR